MRRLALLPLLALTACAPSPTAPTPTDGTASQTPVAPAPAADPTSARPAPERPEVAPPASAVPVDPQGSPSPAEWLTDVDPAETAGATMAVGCTTPPSLDDMTPVEARQGLFEHQGAPGVAMAFAFADEDAARRFQEAWIDQVLACDGAEEVAHEDGYWAGHRDIDGARWTESTVLHGSHLNFLAVGLDLDDDATRALSESQREG